jgi:hypothetical protein
MRKNLGSNAVSALPSMRRPVKRTRWHRRPEPATANIVQSGAVSGHGLCDSFADPILAMDRHRPFAKDQLRPCGGSFGDQLM